MRLQALTIGWVALLFSVSLDAHHAQAPFFDQSREVEIEGVVTRFDFRNPHPVLYVDVTNDDGEVEFVVADVALATNEGVWVAGLPDLATIITVGQGFVVPGTMVNAVAESDVETAVAIKSEDED